MALGSQRTHGPNIDLGIFRGLKICWHDSYRHVKSYSFKVEHDIPPLIRDHTFIVIILEDAMYLLQIINFWYHVIQEYKSAYWIGDKLFQLVLQLDLFQIAWF